MLQYYNTSKNTNDAKFNFWNVKNTFEFLQIQTELANLPNFPAKLGKFA